MKLVLIAVGQKIPAWAQTACDDYVKRFGNELKLEVVSVKTEPRSSKSLPNIYAAEYARIKDAIASRCKKNPHIVVLDEHGQRVTTLALAEKLTDWQHNACDVALIIGGPDGISPELKQKAHEKIRLSDLTLPHALARVLLVEQLYRSWALSVGHPYHRE